VPVFYPARRYHRFGLAMGLTPRLLHERFGLDYGERFHRDVVHRVESLKEIDRLVWECFGEIGLGYENPFPRATLEPFGHRFVPVLYGCRCVYAAAEEPAVLPRPLDPELIRGLKPWTDERFEAEEAVREVLAQARLARERFGPQVAAAQALEHNPHFQPLSSLQNLGSVINTAVSVFGAEALFLYADDQQLLKRFYRNVTQAMLIALRVFPSRDGRRLREVFVGDCTVAMISPESYARCNLDFDRELAEFARAVGARFLVHQDSGATPHLANYARLSYVQSLDFGQDTDFEQAARLFPGTSANCILFPAWLQSTPARDMQEELERLMRVGLSFGDFTFSVFEVDPALAGGKVFEFVDAFRKAAEKVSQGGDT
jgi:hypothetical protein